MEYFIIWEITGAVLKIITSNEASLFSTFAEAKQTKELLEVLHPENKYFIRVFREPEIINALNK